jgi:hypothetical protein
MYGGNAYEILGVNLKGKKPLGRLDIDGRIFLK